MNHSVHYSSDKMDWATPLCVFDDLAREFQFTIDVCASSENRKCERYFSKEDDGLSRSWQGERCWMNPPYGREIAKWMEKAHNESKLGCCVVCLVPSRTDTAWWHDHAMKADEIRYIRGRVKFIGGKDNAPFPSAIVIFRGRKP